MAAAFWLLHASMSRIATCPRVRPSPIIPINTVPAGFIFAAEFSNPIALIFSRVDLMRQQDTSPLLTHAISPPQNSGFARLGVAPTDTSNALPRLVQHQPSGNSCSLAALGAAGSS